MDLNQIQQAIANLPEAEYKRLTEWITEHDFARWDKQIEHDLESGRLDPLLKELKQEIREGRTTLL
ncbi:MAG: hypothetical protein EOO39_02485 [Cytophagaceae bacterium]|nr:MAG: hypothetical protein EOO39_02485 [Cytophagaceae bacterium]